MLRRALTASQRFTPSKVFTLSFSSRPPSTQLSEDERILKESVRKFAEEQVNIKKHSTTKLLI